MGSVGEPTGLADALRAVASPDLYRDNAFRLAGLPVDATSAEIRRRATEVRAVRVLDAAPQAQGPLPLVPAADAQRVEQALSRLREPVNALIDGFFWFWPDPGLQVLIDGDIDRAESVWEAARTDVARHNLAVLNHALALDDDHAGKPLPRSGAPLRWRRAYQHWLSVWQSDGFWALFADRVARLDHPGFGPSTTSTFRQHVPLLMASVSAAVALRCLERGLPDEAAAVHWRLANYQGFPTGTRAEAVRAATDSIAERLTSRVEHTARVARQQPAEAPAAARQLYDQAGPLLRTLVMSGAADADGMHDTVARQLLECASLHHQQTNDLPGTLAVLRMAQQTARGPAAIGQIRQNVIEVERALGRIRHTPQRPRGGQFQVSTIGEETPESRRIRDSIEAALNDYQGRRERGELTKEELEREGRGGNDLIPEATLVELANKFSKQRYQDAVEAALADFQRRRERGELTEQELERQRRSGSDVVPAVETLVELANEILRKQEGE
jgi:hypothetical protein